MALQLLLQPAASCFVLLMHETEDWCGGLSLWPPLGGQVNEPFIWHKTVQREVDNGFKRQGSAFQKVLELASTTLQR